MTDRELLCKIEGFLLAAGPEGLDAGQIAVLLDLLHETVPADNPMSPGVYRLVGDQLYQVLSTDPQTESYSISESTPHHLTGDQTNGRPM